ncbi:alpha/beta fold hydrolase [soil metagenome]
MPVLYLHGFRSSPASFKARLLGDAMAARGLASRFQAPQLPASPRAAAALALELASAASVDAREPLTVIGSSLGGYYATWLAERLGCRAVLLNPAVHAARDLATQVGPQTAYHDPAQRFEFEPAFIGELAELQVEPITRPERYWLICATGDEVLDWREMAAHFSGCRQNVIEGSDHGLSQFSDWVAPVLDFCELEAPDQGTLVP